MIEKLACLKATSSQNYDYVVLQATENSIPFYESMGFTRVGCIQGKAPSPAGYATSPIKKYVVQKEWEKPVDIARQFGVDALDLEFLNIPVWGPTFKKNVWLKKGTEVFVPLINEKDVNNTENASIKWYTAKEDETPRGIAMKHKVKYADFLAANQRRYPELVGNSRLKEGTRIQVSRFDIDDSDYMPYPHWTFPDDELDEETNEPSYMMALKLNRKFGKAADDTPVEDSFAVKIQPYSPETSGVKKILIEPKVSQFTTSVKPKRTPKEPKKPKRPPTPFLLFCTHVRATKKSKFAGKSFIDSNKLISDMWKRMSDEEKSPFYEQFEESKPAYAEAVQQYERDLATFHRNNPLSSGPAAGVDTSMLEQVVKLKSTDGIPGYASKYEYFYVLTYIPDLLWVHLIPMRKVGTFDEKKRPSCDGRPIWMIVSEDEGKEFDTSAAICKVVSSRTINNSADADEEQWDIYESGNKPALAPIFAGKTVKHPAVISDSSSSNSTHKAPKSSKREKPSQMSAAPKQQKKTSCKGATTQTTMKKKPQIAAKTSGKSDSRKRYRTPTTTTNSPTRPKRSLINQSTIGSKVSSGSCGVKIRLSGHVFDNPESLEDMETYSSHTVKSPSLITAIKNGACALKVKVMGEDINLQVETKPRTRPTAPLHPSERKLAPLFLKKYTKKSASKPTLSSTPRRGQRDRSPLHSPANSPRRSPRVQRKCNTPENHDALTVVVSDDGFSESSHEYMPRRKRMKTQ